MDTLSTATGLSSPACMTGKRLSLGGSVGRGSATGLGVAHCVKLIARRLGLGQPVRSSYRVSGTWAPRRRNLLSTDPLFVVVGIGDVYGARYAEQGSSPTTS